MALPDFLVIGAAKAGSTALSAMLGQHPELYMVPHEVHFFSRDEHYERGLAWYESLFGGATDGVRVRGENSNSYTMRALYPHAVERISRHMDTDALRLVYLVRNPLERIESFWIEKRSHGGEDVHHDFSQAVLENRDWLVDPSRYWAQLCAYREVVDDARIHVMFSEDLRDDPDAEMRRCFGFLGVDPDATGPVGEVRENPSADKQVVRPSLSRLRSTAGYGMLPRLVPRPVRPWLRRKLFFGRVAGRRTWDPAVRAQVAEELAGDAARLLGHCGRSPELWKLR